MIRKMILLAMALLCALTLCAQLDGLPTSVINATELTTADGKGTLGTVSLALTANLPQLGVCSSTRCTGKRRYALNDHLANVRAVVSDRRLANAVASNVVDYSTDVQGWTDHYAYGQALNGRNASASSYRYGFNGLEEENEPKGVGRHYTSKYREYDPRVGQWMSIDPKPTTGQSPYSSMASNPVRYNDPLGDTIRFIYARGENNDGNFDYQQGITENQELVLAEFMSTEEGYNFIADFAVAGQTIAGHTFEKDGALVNHKLTLSEVNLPAEEHIAWEGRMAAKAKYGRTSPLVDRHGKVGIYIEVYTYRHGSMGEALNTSAHEALLHNPTLTTEIPELQKAYDAGGSDAMWARKREMDAARAKASNGHDDHDAQKAQDMTHPGYKRFKTFGDQLLERRPEYREGFEYEPGDVDK